MAALSANLLAAAAPPLNPPVSTTSQTLTATQPNATSGFASVLSQATGSAPEVPANSLELETETAGTPAGSELAAALAAIGLVAQPLPVQLPTAPTAGTSATAIQPAGETGAIGEPALLPTVPNTTATTSRSVELQLDTAPAARTPATQPLADTLPTTPDILVADEPTQGVPVNAQAERPTTTVPTTTVAVTTTDVVRAAARPPAVAPQTPVVVEKSQQLPAQPAEMGYNLLGPTVSETPAVNAVAAVGGTPSQAQLEQLAARLPTAEPTTPVNANAPARPATRFEPVLAAEASPTTAVPTSTQLEGTSRPTFNPAEAASSPTRTPVDAPTEAVTAPAIPADTVFAQPPAATTRVSEQAFFVFPQPTPSTGQPTLVEPVEVNTPAADAPATTTYQPTTVPTAEPTPTAAPRVATTAPPVAAQVSEAFVTHARVIESGGTHEFQLRLDPPELGEVKVRVLAMGDRVEARLVVSDDAVKRLIESQLPELRQRLEAAGVSVPSFDVSTGGGKADTGGDGWDRSQPAFAPTPRPAAGPTPRPLPHPGAAGGLLDVTA